MSCSLRGAGLRATPRSALVVAVFLLFAATAVAQMGILDDPARTDAERARDPGSKPLEVYAWLGIESGMTVGDIVPSAGYNTFILAKVVGSEGHVYAVGTNEQGKQRLDARFAEAEIDNVDVMLTVTEVPADSVDAFICVRNVHDMMIPDVAEQYGMQPDPIMNAAYEALKPGGIFGVVDARTNKVEGADPDTHRVNQDAVIELMQSYGFEFVESSELLANPNDDQSSSEFSREDPSGRYTLDRMLLKFRKPAM